jgi:calcium-translocating P-type ATPase
MSEPHAIAIEDVFKTLNTRESGLDKKEVQLKLSHYGKNALTLAAPTPSWRLWLNQFNNPFIYILILSASISLGFQHFVDAGVIVAVILINATIGFIQEGKAETALLSIMAMTKNYCSVIREGIVTKIDSGNLVPGDIVLLDAGDKVPADMRLFYCKDCCCDESLLTGESQNTIKNIDLLASDTILSERTNMVYMGTLVTKGNAKGVVVYTGKQTQIGHIHQLVQQISHIETPLQYQLSQLAKYLTSTIVLLTAFVFVFGTFVRNYPINEMFQGAIGIAVAAIPEGLPAILTIVLAIGVQRMAAQHALVRRLAAVEVLGSVDVICTDKTGTLTANNMTVRQIITASSHSTNIQLEKACEIALLCNDAQITQKNNRWITHGDPTEIALYRMGLEYGIDPKQLNPRQDLLPFDSETRYMVTLHDNQYHQQEMAIKGAPDKLLALSAWQLNEKGDVESLDLTYWNQQLELLASQGMRVLALAYKIFTNNNKNNNDKKLDHAAVTDLVMVALVGISDPPRPEAKAAITSCRSAGIRVIMITGDNPLTAAVIGRELGLDVQQVMTGAELDLLNPQELKQVAKTVNVFARTSPVNKLQLVDALQNAGHTVAMTGDGVNDAPALRKADIGVGMGLKGTDAAREAAAFVLTDDNFATIVKAVTEGRRIYDNIVKSISFILPTDLAEASIIIIAILLGLQLPITPVQILWVNTVTAITLALALVFEPTEKNTMHKPPRSRHQRIITLNLLYRILITGGLGATAVFTIFEATLQQGLPIEQARAMAVNALVIFECFYILAARSFDEAIWHKNYWRNAMPVLLSIMLVMTLQMIFTYLPLSQRIFSVSGLTGQDWLKIIAVTFPIFIIVECEKWITRRRHLLSNMKNGNNNVEI